ncbi:hypothetical protein OBBRIDRAFT_737325 [Obba rivulosa]|uniref:Uncharacterized protein n=1 Tax=Obba rivulosa TaxID=1052685 RepID=A0A8E2DHB7_9APHY|nr:hypothetical protein OBBRIDRAFT_737325 [Obba rivulosa]
MSQMNGPFPPDFLKQCLRWKDYFTDDGALLRASSFELPLLEELLQTHGTIQEVDAIATAAFMRKCMTIKPYKHPVQSELLQDE